MKRIGMKLDITALGIFIFLVLIWVGLRFSIEPALQETADYIRYSYNQLEQMNDVIQEWNSIVLGWKESDSVYFRLRIDVPGDAITWDSLATIIRCIPYERYKVTFPPKQQE